MSNKCQNSFQRLWKLSKLRHFCDSEIVKRGLSLVKVIRQEVKLSNVFRAKIVDISPNTLTIELINAFIDLVEPYGIEEIARTGMTALERGANIIKT